MLEVFTQNTAKIVEKNMKNRVCVSPCIRNIGKNPEYNKQQRDCKNLVAQILYLKYLKKSIHTNGYLTVPPAASIFFFAEPES